MSHSSTHTCTFAWCLVFTVCSLCIVSCQHGETSPEAQEAYERAGEYIGFLMDGRTLASTNDQAYLMTIEDDETPFLRKEINGSTAWHIVLRDVDLADLDTAYTTESEKRDLDVYLDSASGKLLRVVCDYKPMDSNEVGELTPEYVEDYFSAVGEIWKKFPDSLPEKSLSDILRRCSYLSKKAKYFEAQLVVSPFLKKDMSIWHVTVRGIPNVTAPRGRPGGARRRPLPENQTNHRRLLYSADRGRLPMSTTSPQYPLLDDWEPLELPDSLKGTERAKYYYRKGSQGDE